MQAEEEPEVAREESEEEDGRSDSEDEEEAQAEGEEEEEGEEGEEEEEEEEEGSDEDDEDDEAGSEQEEEEEASDVEGGEEAGKDEEGDGNAVAEDGKEEDDTDAEGEEEEGDEEEEGEGADGDEDGEEEEEKEEADQEEGVGGEGGKEDGGEQDDQHGVSQTAEEADGGGESGLSSEGQDAGGSKAQDGDVGGQPEAGGGVKEEEGGADKAPEDQVPEEGKPAPRMIAALLDDPDESEIQRMSHGPGALPEVASANGAGGQEPAAVADLAQAAELQPTADSAPSASEAPQASPGDPHLNPQPAELEPELGPMGFPATGVGGLMGSSGGPEEVIIHDQKEVPANRPDSLRASREDKDHLIERIEELEEENAQLHERVQSLLTTQQATAWTNHEYLREQKEAYTAIEALNTELASKLKQQEEMFNDQAKAMAGLVLEKQKLEGKLSEAAEFSKSLDDALKEANEAISSLTPNVNSEVVAVREIMKTAFEDAAAAASLYEKEVEQLREENAQAVKESKAAAFALREYRAWVDQELTDITDQILTLQESTRKANSTCEAAVARAEAAEAEASASQHEAMAGLQAELESARQELATAKEELESLHSENADSKDLLEKSQEQCESNRRLLLEVNTQLSNMREESDALKEELTSRNAVVQELEEKLEEKIKEAAAGETDSKLDHAQEEAKVAKELATKAVAKMKAAMGQAKTMETARDNLVHNMKVIEGEVKALTNALTREREKHSKCREDLSNAVTRRRNADMALSRLQDDHKMLKAVAADRAKMLQDTRNDLETWRSDCQEWRKEATETMVKLKNLEKQKSSEEAKDKQRTDKGMAELQDRVKHAESEAHTMKSEAAVLKEMVHTLKVEVRQKEKQENDLKRKLKQLQNYYGAAA